MNKGNYSGSDDVIAAHEYGHLLGIPDEYSQSNEQMHALLHQSSPAGAASAGAALDRTTVERMVLAALQRPLFDRLAASVPAVTSAFQAKRALVVTKMGAAARTGAASAPVTEALRAQLAATSDPTLGASVPGVVAFETTSNFSAHDRAAAGVADGFSATAISALVTDSYWKALSAPQSAVAAVAGLGDVSIRIAGGAGGAAPTGVWAAGMSGGPQAAAGGGLATSVVGPAGGPGVPAAPSASLVGQITALPGTWYAAGSALDAGVTPAAFAAKMEGVLKAAAVASSVAAAIATPLGLAPAKIKRAGPLYRRAYDLVRQSSQTAAQQVTADLLNATIPPVLQAGVASLQAAITAEVAKVMTTSPGALATTATPDPNMVAMVAAMKARLDAAKAATAGGGRDPLGSGAAAPAQDVTYSYQGRMGSNVTGAVRADQFEPMVRQFNDKMKTTFEKAFKAEVK